MNRIVFKYFLMILLLPSFGSFASSKGGFMKCFREELDPTEGQMLKVQEIMKKNRSKREEMKKEFKESKEKMQELEKRIASDTSADALRSLFIDAQNGFAQARTIRFENFLAIREILTIEQRERLHKCRMGFSATKQKGK